MTPWGYHLMLDCRGMNDALNSKKEITKFVKELVIAIDMVAVGKPIIKYLCENDPKSGYSLVQLIQTSNITAHFMDQDRTAYFDVFSCKKFEPAIVESIVKKYFNPSNIKSNFLTRRA